MAEQRVRHGTLHAALRGPAGRPKADLMAAREDIADMFKQTVDEVERNHSLQVRSGGGASFRFLAPAARSGL